MVQTFSAKDVEVKLSENFKVGEFDCKCGQCDRVLVDEDLVKWLQLIRDHFGGSVHVNSGYRCPDHNKKVGGSATSHHMRGMAADIRVQGATPTQVARYAEIIGVQRIGLYDCFVHIGSDNRKRFWKGHEGVEVESHGGDAFTLELPVLRRGSKGETVKALQAQLIGLGYDCGDCGMDGSFGAATERAVKNYQSDHALVVNGIVGDATRRSMLGL
jgi:hypothetical protein